MGNNFDDIKNYLRINHNIDDEYIETLFEFSKKFIEEQTGVQYCDNDEVYKMAVLQVAAHFYDKRESVSDKSSITVPFTMDCLIKHIGMRGTINNE